MNNNALLNKKEKQRRFAWAKFFESQEQQMNTDIQYVVKLESKIEPLPNHIKEEFKELLTEMKKKIECGICTEQMKPDEIMFLSPCFHKICKSCYEIGNITKCPYCRKTIYKSN